MDLSAASFRLFIKITWRKESGGILVIREVTCLPSTATPAGNTGDFNNVSLHKGQFTSFDVHWGLISDLYCVDSCYFQAFCICFILVYFNVCCLRLFYFIVPYGSLCIWGNECFLLLFLLKYCMWQCHTYRIICMYKALSEDVNTLAHRMFLCGYWHYRSGRSEKTP